MPKRKVVFLAIRANDSINLIAMKFKDGNWMKFHEDDVSLEKHPVWLRQKVNYQIKNLKNCRKLRADLNEDQLKVYYNEKDDVFIYNNHLLKLDQGSIEDEEVAKDNKTKKRTRLVQTKVDLLKKHYFDPETMNPVEFVDRIEQCSDNQQEDDRSHNLLQFVDDVHKLEFNLYYRDYNYEEFKSAFVEKYSPIYTSNIHKQLDKTLSDYDSLFDFFKNQFKNYKKLTSLPDEAIKLMLFLKLNEKVHNLFIVAKKDKVDLEKTLEFCNTLDQILEYEEMLKNQSRSIETDESHEEPDPSMDNGSYQDDNSKSPMYMQLDDLPEQSISDSESSESSQGSKRSKRFYDQQKRNKKSKLAKISEEFQDESSNQTV